MVLDLVVILCSYDTTNPLPLQPFPFRLPRVCIFNTKSPRALSISSQPYSRVRILRTQTSMDTLQHRSQPDCRHLGCGVSAIRASHSFGLVSHLLLSFLFLFPHSYSSSKCGAIHHTYKNVWFLLDLYYCFPHSSQPVLLVLLFNPTTYRCLSVSITPAIPTAHYYHQFIIFWAHVQL